MKTLIVAGVLALSPIVFTSAATDYYLKIDTMEGESTTQSTSQTELKLRGDGSVDDTQGGNVEFEWQVEEGEKAQDGGDPDRPVIQGSVPNNQSGEKGGTEDINIGVGELNMSAGEQESATNFGILLGGGSENEEEAQKNRDKVAKILLEGMKETDIPVESISLNFEKITTKSNAEVKLFGFIPLSAQATVEIDAEQRVKVKFPWWAFLASGKNKEELGQRVFTTLSDVLKTRHDTVKNSINNVR
jgi:hypothetical protein